MPDNNCKTFDWILQLDKKEIRGHLDNLRNLPQCPNIRFWESLTVIESFLTAKGFAEESPERTASDIIKNNKIYFRKEN